MKERYHLSSCESAVAEALAQAREQDWVRRIWARDAAVWKTDEAHRQIISNALGWLSVAEDLQPRLDEIRKFTNRVREEGFRTACLLGIGGSSLCPEVCAEAFGTAQGYLRLIILDTTDPATILDAERGMDIPRTLFIVASKSGSTIESASLHKYFYHRVRAIKGDRAGESFLGITDPGTSLEIQAKDQGFRYTFLNPTDIGGRFSALSFFGLVPMSLVGMDIGTVIDRAITMAQRCRVTGEPDANVGVRLGCTLGALARAGRDKVTFVLSPEIRTFGYWVEQLIAESTGKEGTGILPVESEPLASSSCYGPDRVFVSLEVGDRPDTLLRTQLRELEDAGHPVIHRELEDRYDIAGEFFLWEYATAVAGAVLAIDPFDQPDVQESKDNTRQLIGQYCESGRLEDDAPLLREGPVTLHGDPERIRANGGLRAALDSILATAAPGDYVALLAYLQRTDADTQTLQRIRLRLRNRLKCATTLGFGPRFLHSTGQLHKGGADNGLFLQVTADSGQDLAIPGEKYGFSTLKSAQALGDLQALRQRGRRAVRVHLGRDVNAGLAALEACL